MRGALGPERQLYQAFPLGGRICSLEINAVVWKEFVPSDPAADLVLVQVPVVDGPAGTRILHTNSRTFPDLVDGAALTGVHVELAVDVYPGQDVVCVDRDAAEPVRLFYAVSVEAPLATAKLIFMEAAR